MNKDKWPPTFTNESASPIPGSGQKSGTLPQIREGKRRSVMECERSQGGTLKHQDKAPSKTILMTHEAVPCTGPCTPNEQVSSSRLDAFLSPPAIKEYGRSEIFLLRQQHTRDNGASYESSLPDFLPQTGSLLSAPTENEVFRTHSIFQQELRRLTGQGVDQGRNRRAIQDALNGFSQARWT